VLTISRNIAGQQIVPREVAFPFPRPADTEAYRSCFRAPLHFDRPQGALLLSRGDLDLPVTTGDPTLRGYLEQLADQALGSIIAPSSFADRVRQVLWTRLSAGRPSLEQMSAKLGLSVRTVQRRLHQEGTSFADLLEEFRREMASHLLRDPSLAAYEIAFLLGYSDPSTFFRAFRRWYGVSPQEFRRRSIA
jgi:AraC-like DNA-binding protein